jgi:pilus assembly protein CpaB
MARNTTPIIIGAVVLGFLALGLTFFVINGTSTPGPNPNPQPTAEQPPVTTWVARRTIYPRTLVTADMLTESSNPAKNPNAVVNRDDLIGRIATRKILAGETFVADAVTRPVARVIPANIPIPAGLRGVAIWVNRDETAAGLVDAGDRVDVIATHDLSGGKTVAGSNSVDFTAGHTVVQDVEVLAVDKSLDQAQYSAPATPTTAGQPGANGQQAAAPTPAAPPPAPATNPQPGQKVFIRVILAATPQDAQRLVTANKKGDLHITIRNPQSRERYPIGETREHPVRYADLTPTPNRPAAAASADERREDKNRAAGLELLKTVFNANRPAGSTIQPAIPTPNIGTISPADNKEVTVIRGTEKTRVVVPR